MLISLILLTHDREDMFKQALASALCQAGVDFEIIVSNSGKNHVEIPDDNRIRYYKWDDGPTGVQNFNRAIKESHGDIIAILHDDDILTDKLSLWNRVRYFDLFDGLEFVYSGFNLMSWDGKITSTHEPYPINIKQHLLVEQIHGGTMMWRKSVHDKIGYWPEDLLIQCDYYWKIRCLMECYCAVTKSICYNYREHGGQHSLLTRNSDGFHAENKLVKNKFKELYGGLF